VCIEQLMMTDVTGLPFPEIMRKRVFEPIGMSSSTYEQPLPPERSAIAASGTSNNGSEVAGLWHVYPEMAAAGLWTTPTDLAKLGIELARSSQGRANHVLSQEMTREMLSPQFPRVGESTWGDKRHPDRMGLGFFLGDSSRAARFGHIGNDEGFSAILIMFGDTGQGAAIMVNSEMGIVLANLVLANVAKEYGWHFRPPLYPMLVTLLYVFLAVPVALALASVLGVFYATSRAPRAWIAYALGCLLTVFAHSIPALMGLWPDWMLHPLRGPFGGMLLLMPVTIALFLLAPIWRRRRWRPSQTHSASMAQES
jgi:CubicO group peptidase (beta-lactamase class C family)